LYRWLVLVRYCSTASKNARGTVDSPITSSVDDRSA